MPSDSQGPLLPPVGVLPTKMHRGILSPEDDEAENMAVVSFEDAFSTQWETDAHFVCYSPLPEMYEVSEGFPRIRKAALQKIRDRGGDIRSRFFAVDYDNPGHRPWEPGQFDKFLDCLVAASDTFPEAARFNLLYQTRNGARLVWLLEKDLPVDIAEKHHRGLVSKLIAAGVDIADKFKCSDWTRCFRLPFVIRDGKKTWEETVETVWQPEHRLDATTLPAIEGNDREGQEYGDVEYTDSPKPDDAEALALCWVGGDVGGKMTDYMKRAKSQLRGRECFPCIFEHKPIAVQGERDTNIQKYVGQAVGCLIGAAKTQDTDEAKIYGMFLSSVKDLEPDAQTPDWTDVLWDKIVRLCAMQRAKVQVLEEKKVEQAAVAETETRSLLERVLTGMREWCMHPALHDTSDNNRSAAEWASGRMIVSVANSYFVMMPNGRYCPKALLGHQVVPFLKRNKMDSIVEVDQIIEGVGIRPRPLADIMHQHGTIADDVVMTPQQIVGGIVDNMDSHDAVIRVSAFRRRQDLIPTFDAQVDQWLQHFFGSDYELGKKWIAWALAFDEGAIAALAIKGEQGTGKKMFVQGLAECLVRAEIADYEDLASPYQYGLLTSPFLCVNEGESLPRVGGGQGPYHQFRRLVTADPIRANRKNMHPISIRVPYRVMFTSNNDDVVTNLVGKGNLSPEDRNALMIRLIHLNIGDAASRWLRAQGGMALTGRPGRRWIAGDGGVSSDYVVAKHFLWLYENRKTFGPTGSRLLVEGNAGADLMFKLRTGSGAAPLVIETLLKMIESSTMPSTMAIDDDRLFVLVHGVTDYFRQNLAQKIRENLTDQMVTTALKGLSVRQENPPRVLETRRAQGRVRWMELDAEAIYAVAERNGYTCPKLLAVVEKQRAKYGTRKT